MKLSCSQMDVLISFYIEGDLSEGLKKQVENHLKTCASCRAKFEIIKNMIEDLRNCFNDIDDEESVENETKVSTNVVSQQYRVFKNNLSAYLDNELNGEENFQIKKFTVNNKQARKELEKNYNLRRLMSNSFQKVKNENKYDFSKNVLKGLELDEDIVWGFHPIVKMLIGFIVAVAVLTMIALFSLV